MESNLTYTMRYTVPFSPHASGCLSLLPGSLGSQISVIINSFEVSKLPDHTLVHYDNTGASCGGCALFIQFGWHDMVCDVGYKCINKNKNKIKNNPSCDCDFFVFLMGNMAEETMKI